MPFSQLAITMLKSFIYCMKIVTPAIGFAQVVPSGIVETEQNTITLVNGVGGR